ncbi:MAG TPA: tetratricopeptide repeat protein [Candidatus Udaeobacter sp.]|jgi:tetratricopeptide (TPR) repeat protein|nr:tetratricopeptide repeat protein [Candidatus Udaeobacter sp.]
MTFTPPHRQRRLAVIVILAVMAVGSSGCAVRSVAHRANLVASRVGIVPETTASREATAREKCASAPAEPYWPFQLAELYVDADSIGQAESALRESLHRDAHYAPALSLLSKIYFESGRHEQAIRLLETARGGSGELPGEAPPELAADLAIEYDAVDDLARARATLADVRGESKSLTSARVYLTLRGTHPDSAASLAADAVNEDGHSAANHNNYGIAQLRAGDVEGARRSFLKAIDLDSKLAGPYYNLAILDEFFVFDDDAALKWFRAYRERSHADPDSLEAVFERIGSSKLVGKDGER